MLNRLKETVNLFFTTATTTKNGQTPKKRLHQPSAILSGYHSQPQGIPILAMKVTIVNLDVGNIGAIPTMLKRLACDAEITQDPAVIEQAERLILPGVGAFDTAMAKLDQLGLRDALNRKVRDKKTPILGICLGMQLFATRSDEGQRDGLGWIPARVIRFRFDPGQTALRIPHMGWNTVTRNPNIPLFDGYADDPRFYFVHSYHYEPDIPNTQTASTTHGHAFPAVVCRGNILGVQFHPEKSHRFGLTLLDNFLKFQHNPATTSPESASERGTPC